MYCRIIVPANPLSAQGLATPWQLEGPAGMTPAQSGCTMANSANLGAFVQATILDPATGALSVYEPLVITQGTTPAVAPVVPTLPAGAVVTMDVGFNGTDLTQVGATPTALAQGRCVNGLGAGPTSARCRSATGPASSGPRSGPRRLAGWSCPRPVWPRRWPGWPARRSATST